MAGEVERQIIRTRSVTVRTWTFNLSAVESLKLLGGRYDLIRHVSEDPPGYCVENRVEIGVETGR
jgi:hypothetical protein